MKCRCWDTPPKRLAPLIDFGQLRNWWSRLRSEPAMKAIVPILVGSFCLSASAASGGSSNLSSPQLATLQEWLIRHPTFRRATAKDCDCDDDIRQMRTVGSFEGPIPDYDPYTRVGDFRHNGQSDFAVVVIDGGKQTQGTLLIFDGPFQGEGKRPAFVGRIGQVSRTAIFKSPKGPWPVVGEFESEGCAYLPRKGTYITDCKFP